MHWIGFTVVLCDPTLVDSKFSKVKRNWQLVGFDIGFVHQTFASAAEDLERYNLQQHIRFISRFLVFFIWVWIFWHQISVSEKFQMSWHSFLVCAVTTDHFGEYKWRQSTKGFSTQTFWILKSTWRFLDQDSYFVCNWFLWSLFIFHTSPLFCLSLGFLIHPFLDSSFTDCSV